MTEEQQQDTGIVSAVAGSQVSVEIQRGGGCKSCAMRGMCFSKSTPAVFHLQSELPLQVGDRVELEISAQGRLMASMLIFGMPVVMLFLGFILASIWLAELPSIIFAFAGMAFSFFILRFCDRRLGSKIKVEIARKIEDSTE
ncbi:MAG: SoxR reducing system RseC family protein [Candidatus Cloacimonetes bacterium]|nr:SoxR reducing system RseC family protein [Candidatus Cloacimonadota bacterium]MDD2544085.1 SoxR reducing system RseC family protein [Candidatus Cloacimonadota bacterium]MDD3096824.1 SoxR reducing system RseC family protein [Candidatus Cloacimonadota bacterium]MDD3577391.1 SoxR reducing system RseC family protein [Candidatus Cloacimonadota bacterium]HRX76000.1 SoxR reducing system RseC family protein [Candidatus Cloacimonadota bacterium]